VRGLRTRPVVDSDPPTPGELQAISRPSCEPGLTADPQCTVPFASETLYAVSMFVKSSTVIIVQY